MSTSSLFRRAFQVLLPATLLLTACGKDDVVAPVVDQGRITYVNAASHIPGATLRFLVDNSQKASQTYGASSGYQSVPTGSRIVQVASGTQTVLTQPAITVEKDRSYTFVAAPAASPATVSGFVFPDDLTAPASGKAKIRVIHLGQNLSNPIRLAQVTNTAGGPVVVNIVAGVASNTASPFTEFTPGDYRLSIMDNAGVTKAELGSGTGAGTGTKVYEAGKLYTVVVSGTADSADPAQALKGFLSQNN